MERWIRVRLAGVTGVALLMLLAPGLASAACPRLDAACMADEMTSGGADPVTDPPVDPGDATGALGPGAGPSLSPIIDRADQILHGEGVDAPVGRGGTSGGDGRGHTGRPGSGPTGAGPTTDVGRRAVGPLAPGRSTLDPGRPVSDADEGLAPRPDPILIAARSVVTILLLLAVAGIFVLIQDRLDRGDPRLSGAPLRPETIPFR